MTKNHNILNISNLSLKLNNAEILKDISLELWKGYIYAIVGPNGSGKSTLASTIMGLNGYTKHDGDIYFEDKPIKDKSVDERAKMGITLAWQEPARFEGLTVKNLLMASAKDKRIEALKSTMQLVGLDPVNYMTRSVDKTLSGGERKKIELCSLLLMNPKLAVLDEPDSGIDIESINKIFDAIKLLKKQGTTIILITHSLAVLKRAEHAFLLCDGKIINKGIVDDISYYFRNNCQKCETHEPDKLK